MCHQNPLTSLCHSPQEGEVCTSPTSFKSEPTSLHLTHGLKDSEISAVFKVNIGLETHSEIACASNGITMHFFSPTTQGCSRHAVLNCNSKGCDFQIYCKCLVSFKSFLLQGFSLTKVLHFQELANGFDHFFTSPEDAKRCPPTFLETRRKQMPLPPPCQHRFNCNQCHLRILLEQYGMLCQKGKVGRSCLLPAVIPCALFADLTSWWRATPASCVVCKRVPQWTSRSRIWWKNGHRFWEEASICLGAFARPRDHFCFCNLVYLGMPDDCLCWSLLYCHLEIEGALSV